MSAVDTVVAESGSADSPSDPPPVQKTRWPLAGRLLFRFGVLYCTLFIALFGQILAVFFGLLYLVLPDSAPMWPMVQLAPLFEWVGRTVLGIETTFDPNSGSGDQSAFWVMAFCALVVAAVVAVLWSILDRRPADPRLAAWFLTGLRFCLAGQMLFYGIAKTIPTQMPTPALSTLLEPFGQFTPMSVLWTQVGSSPVYEILLGVAELSAGLLLLLPRTATLGAMLSLVSMAQVFVLNMTFDVPVKLLSFHLMVFSLILLAPQLRRMLDFFLLARRAEPAVQPPLFTGRRANRYAVWVQAVVGLWMVAGVVHVGYTTWYEFGGGAPKPALYGMWEVAEFRLDGQPVAPLTTDETRWQRLVIEYEGAATVQQMDGALITAPALVDPAAHSLTLPAQPGAQNLPVGTFTYDRPEPGRLFLEGTLDGRPATIDLRSTDLDSFPLNQDRFHWIRDQPNQP